MKYFIFSFVFILVCTSCKNDADKNASDKAANIILLIGDGMGLTQITAGLYSNNDTLNIERFPVIGLHKNFASNNLITDSAAGATAFACGVKTYNGAIGVNPDTMPVISILEECVEKGYKTGLVATSTIVHATPASFAAHNKARGNYEEIASDMAASGVDLMIGGGKSFFDRRSSDDRNLYDEMKEKGYKISDYFAEDFQDLEVDSMGDKWAFFTADSQPLSKEAGREYLVPASKIAIDFISEQAGDDPFFLMIEGSQIDWAGHANNFPYMVSEMLEYDEVVKLALDFAEKDGNTLVVLTADHETGGLAINNGSTRDSIIAAYTSDYHTATMIPVFAYGPGSERFAGIYDNTAIYSKMKKAIKLDEHIEKEN